MKGNIGHTLAAAGAAGILSASLALAHRRIPPLAGHERARRDLPLGDAGLEIATGGAREWSASRAGPRAAAVSSFGFGGTNVHVVLEEAPRLGARRASAPAWRRARSCSSCRRPTASSWPERRARWRRG